MAPELVPGVPKSSCFTRPATLPSRAYVTFLAGNGDYMKGLRKVKTAYPLVVAVLPDVPEDHCRILESQGCIVREIEPVYPPENQTQFAIAYYVINYSKLRIWAFVEYDKMIYLDGDKDQSHGSILGRKRVLVQKWWDIYNDESLDYKKQQSGAVVAVAAEQAVDMQPYIEDLRL